MPATDIKVTDATVRFRRVQLDQALSISGRAIAAFTLAEVRVEVVNRAGGRARGLGMSVLSVPWAWPEAQIDVPGRDRALRELTEELARASVGAGPQDPISLWRRLYGDLDARLDDLARRHGVPAVPRLAGLLPLGAVDNAVHDAWALAAGHPASTMYDGDHLGTDLGWLDPALRGRYPGDFLARPLRVLPVQHVVGVDDPLTPAEARTSAERPLSEWLRTEGVRHLKIKVAGRRPEEDARRVADVARLGRELCGQVRLALDPNEGCTDAAAVQHLLDEIRSLGEGVISAIDYIEQPVPRGPGPQPSALGLTEGAPVLLDEGFSDLTMLPGLPGLGWSGVVIKAAKGHSLALLSNAVAKAHGLQVAVQDLTAVSWALVHSARLVSLLDPTWPHLEYNSRQYAPAAATALAEHLPGLALVDHGAVRLPSTDGPGLYQLPVPTDEDPW